MASGGEFGGAEKCCHHALAQFCEKVRIATGSKKSRKRLAIEAQGRIHTPATMGASGTSVHQGCCRPR